MRTLFGATGILASTFSFLAVLFVSRPFEVLNDHLDRAFGALPAWTQVEHVYRDPHIQETSHGDHPLESFDFLNQHWSRFPKATRIILMGNSQTQAVSLAPGELPPQAPEKTYPDLMADYCTEKRNRCVLYRISAGALSYAETLWYLNYLVQRTELKPDILLLQMNYQGFANANIRDGMLEMLSDPRFHGAVERIASSDAPYAETFQQALIKFDQARARTRGNRQQAQSTRTGLTTVDGFGTWLETVFRTHLENVPGFERRSEFKQAFASLLYRGRTYVLHVQTTARRSLRGQHLETSRALVEADAQLCRKNGIRLIVFQAPTNPAVPLYGTEEDDRSYHDFVTGLGVHYEVPVFDFEHSIPLRCWGMSLNVPDPLHLGRAGHRMLADLMVNELVKRGVLEI
jgi:hypothetical protein